MPKTGIEIIYDNAELLVVNKPAGVSVTKDRSGVLQLKDILAGQLGRDAAESLRLIHRLDKDTSGVMILAKTKNAQSLFSSCFAKKLVRKTYLALVTGKVDSDEGIINAPLAHHPKNPALMYIPRKRGKEAITKWRLLADFGPIGLLAVRPVTGRTHQIRIHLPHAGMPLAIDPLYGSDKPLFLSDFKRDYRLGKGQTEKPLIERLTLHAYQIELTESQVNRPNCFVAGLDKKFTAALKMLTRHNPKGLDAFASPDDFSNIMTTRRLC